MMSQTTTDPDAIERDLNATRSRLDSRLSELASRLSPGQLLDEALGVLRTRQGVDFRRNLSDSVRERPLPVALMGVALAWLIMGPRDHSTPGYRASGGTRVGAATTDLAARAWNAGRSVVRNTGESDDAYHGRVLDARAKVLGVMRNAQETTASYGERVQEALFAARNRMSDAVSGAASSVSAAGARLGDAAQNAADSLGAQAHDMRDRAAGWSQGLGTQAQRFGDTVRDSTSGLGTAITESPAMLGALGVAVGALLGALMPATDIERQYLGDAASGLRDSVGTAVRTATDRGGEVANAAAEAVRQTAQDVAQHASAVGSAAAGVAQDAAAQTRDAAANVASRATR